MIRIIIAFLALAAVAFGADSVTIPTVNLSLSAPDTAKQLVSSLNVVVVLTLHDNFYPFCHRLWFFTSSSWNTAGSADTAACYACDDSYAEKIGYEEAFTKTALPFKNFMIRNTREKDLALFLRIRKMQNPKTVADVPLSIVVPAFIISEMKTAFEIGFLLFLPFLVIDMVVASILMSMGMMMLPPVMISLPFKILVFVLIDGWNLLIGNLIASVK